MKIAINKAHFPVTVLGPGRRIGVWFQGCSIGCKGCISQDTWPADPGKQMTVAGLISWCRQVSNDQPDGITISGGEPFDQPEALAALLKGLHFWRNQQQLDFDILCYSGYPYATLKKRHQRLLDRLDALIPEPFIDAKPPQHLLRGSANQTLEIFTERGQRRLADYLQAPFEGGQKRIQTMLDGQRIWFVGIPDRTDMPELEQACRQQGLSFDQVSWRQ